MRVAIIGQQEFGKAVMEAFLARGDEVVGVFTAPERDGARPDPLRVAAQEKGIKLFQLPNLTGDAAREAMQGLNADIGIMAYVVQFAPQELVNIPKHGTIQYHPSLLPKYRGPSSINWPIVCGDAETGLTVFRPDDGLDEGPIVLQKTTPILPDDTLGSVYYDRLFPLGVKAMLEAADLVVAGKHIEVAQDESEASYEGWLRVPESRISWSNHVNYVYNLIRGCNPAPGAWTTLNGKRIHVFEVKKHLFRTFGSVRGKIGTISEIGETSFRVTAQGGQIEIFTLRLEDGKKMTADEFIRQAGLNVGMQLGS
ncbi:MAG: methionyl-tRNA formyltransferase [Burkholderiaceae bacterium]|nr:methionyl-tRNA formyltransferase [Burkholderiaceae bacterium]